MIEFTKDYATKKKGDVMEIATMHASYMVHQQKVAKYWVEKPKRKKAVK